MRKFAPKTRKAFCRPQYGMTKLQLLDLLGKPEVIEIYKKSDQTSLVLYLCPEISSFPSKGPYLFDRQ